MNKLGTILTLAISATMLAACQPQEAEHGHPHDGDATHAQDKAAAQDAHEHGEGGHSHDEPGTEAVYGEEAEVVTEEEAARPHGDHDDGHEHEHEHEDHQAEPEPALETDESADHEHGEDGHDHDHG